jgi:hypothetical protein
LKHFFASYFWFVKYFQAFIVYIANIFVSPFLDVFVFSKKMSHIFVPSIKTGFSADLPTDMDNPGYWFEDSKVGLERIGQYISKQEWQELAHGANAAHKTHAATSNGFVMKLLFGTFGICFCPLMCYGCFVDVEGNVNVDIENLPVAQKLKGRGITLHFSPKRGKFDMGGMDCAISTKTKPISNQYKTAKAKS